MADVVDVADELIEKTLEVGLAEIRRVASEIPEGNPGECEMCGEWSGRLVGQACSRCRDKYCLP